MNVAEYSGVLLSVLVLEILEVLDFLDVLLGSSSL